MHFSFIAFEVAVTGFQSASWREHAYLSWSLYLKHLTQFCHLIDPSYVYIRITKVAPLSTTTLCITFITNLLLEVSQL